MKKFVQSLISLNIYDILPFKDDKTERLNRLKTQTSLIQEIKELKEKHNALILAHYYQIPEIQDIADFVGDSLALAQVGKESEKDIIVVCGVSFMAESAKILSPHKKILLPNKDAGCPMADMVTPEKLSRYLDKHPETYVVSYVNTSAATKAMTDVCVTSSNAVKIMEQLDEPHMLFLPDKNLGGYIKSLMPHKNIELWLGFCCIHERVKPSDILKHKKKYPDAKILVHPECNADVVALGDYVGSTAGIINFAKNDDGQTFIIATEEGVLHRLSLDSPDKTFILAAECLTCKNMKKTSLEDIHQALTTLSPEVILDDDIIKKAYAPLDRMLSMS